MKTGRLASWLAVGLGMTVVGVSACGSDGAGSATPGGDAGATNEGGQGAAANMPGAGQGGAESTVATGGAAGGDSPESMPPSAGEGGGGAVPVVESKDVNGKLRGYDEPVADVKVFVDGKQVTTDGEGRFSVKDVADEYELAVLLESPPNVALQVYRGLRTRTPTIQLGGSIGTPTPYTATIRGVAQGGLPAGIGNAFTYTNWISDTHGRLDLSTVDPPVGFDLNLKWFGSKIDKGEIVVLQENLDDLDGDAFTGWGHRRLVIEDGGYYGSVAGSSLTDVTLTNPEEVAVSGKITVPDGWTLTYSVALRIGQMLRDPTAVQVPGPYKLLVPRVDRPVYLDLIASGDSGSAKRIVPVDLDSNAALNLDLPEPPQPTAPNDGATGIDGKTEFVSNERPANSLSLFYWSMGDLIVYLTTPAPSTTIPDLSQYGLDIPAGQESTWGVSSEGPAANVDEVIELEQRMYGTQSAVTESLVAWSPQRTFFTAK